MKLNRQKGFDAITFMVVVLCMIAGFVIVTDFLALGPDETEVKIQLRQGEIPPNIIRVEDIKEIETIGEVKEVFGTYDFCSCDQTFISISLKRHWDSYRGKIKIVEFYIRGSTSNETFDYIFYKNIPPTNEMGKYSVDKILSFNEETVIVSYYEDSDFFDLISRLLLVMIITIVVGIISSLVMVAIGGILKLDITWTTKIYEYLKEDEK